MSGCKSLHTTYTISFPLGYQSRNLSTGLFADGLAVLAGFIVYYYEMEIEFVQQAAR